MAPVQPAFTNRNTRLHRGQHKSRVRKIEEDIASRSGREDGELDLRERMGVTSQQRDTAQQATSLINSKTVRRLYLLETETHVVAESPLHPADGVYSDLRVCCSESCAHYSPEVHQWIRTERFLIGSRMLHLCLRPTSLTPPLRVLILLLLPPLPSPPRCLHVLTSLCLCCFS